MVLERLSWHVTYLNLVKFPSLDISPNHKSESLFMKHITLDLKRIEKKKKQLNELEGRH